MKNQVHFVWLEGVLEESAARRLLSSVALDASQAVFKVAGSNSAFWQRVPDRNSTAKAGLKVVALADLEQEPCPCAMIQTHLPHGAVPGFVLRLAVRMLESWLLADSEKMAAFLGVPLSKMPSNPDGLDHPKRELVNLARRHSSKRLKDDLVPEEGHTGIVGKGYRPRMEEYIQKHWRPQVAARNSESLRSALAALKKLATTP
jgi:hypothetical protein